MCGVYFEVHVHFMYKVIQQKMFKSSQAIKLPFFKINYGTHKLWMSLGVAPWAFKARQVLVSRSGESLEGWRM